MPKWFSTWFGDPSQDLANLAPIYANTLGSIAGISTTTTTTPPTHSHSVTVAPWQQISNASTTRTITVKCWMGVYGAMIEMVREIAEAGGATLGFAEDDDGIELDLEIYRAGRSAVIDLASIVNMITADRIEDVYRYIEVTLSMLPPAPAHDLADVQNLYAQQAQTYIRQQQQSYAQGWVDPRGIFGSGI